MLHQEELCTETVAFHQEGNHMTCQIFSRVGVALSLEHLSYHML